MKINTVTLVSRDMNPGDTQHFVAELAHYLDTQNIQVHLVTSVDQEVAYSLPSKVEHTALTPQEPSSFLPKSLYRMKLASKLRKTIFAQHSDIVVVFSMQEAIMAAQGGKQHKAPLVIAYRSDIPAQLKQKWKSSLIRSAYKKADGLVFQTHAEKNFFYDSFFTNTVVIPNALLLENLPKRAEKKIKKEIIAVGPLTPEKNHLLLIQAFADIAPTFPDYKLTLYGEGPLRDALEAEILECGLADRVKLAGATSKAPEKMKEAALFVLSSDSEGMSNTLIQAMAIGLPCIATDTPGSGTEFLIQHGENGLLCPVGDRTELSDAMRSILSDKNFADRLSQNAKQIVNILDKQKIMRQWLDFFEEIA